jgi:hypothetical protein
MLQEVRMVVQTTIARDMQDYREELRRQQTARQLPKQWRVEHFEVSSQKSGIYLSRTKRDFHEHRDERTAS